MNRAEKIKILGKTIDDVWMQYGDDMFIDDEGRRDTSMTFNRQSVAEIALDLPYWRDIADKDQEVKESVEWYLNLAYSTRKSVIREAMPISTYGY